MLKTIKEVFVFNLRRLRGDRTQAEIAALAGVSFGSYKNAEYGKVPHSENLSAIASALGVSETALFLDPDLIRTAQKPTPEEALEVLAEIVRVKKN